MPQKILIIGGGVAGLSAGIYGRLNGYDTEILEMHSLPGGQCTAWKRKDYTFDYCIHWLVGSSHGPFHDVWKETGALDDDTVIVDPVRHSTLRLPDGDEFIIHADIDRWESYLLEQAPEDHRAIRRMCKDMRKVGRIDMFDKPPFQRSVRDQLGFALNNRSALAVLLRYGRLSLKQYILRLGLKNEKLKERLLLLGAGMEDFSALAFLFTLVWFSQKNAGYPLGGSLPFAQRMARRYEELGGRFRGNARVEKILVEKGKAVGVRLADGTDLRGDEVIGACDLHALMLGMLEGKHMTKSIRNALETWPLFTPVVQVSFGIDTPVEAPVQMLQVHAPGDSMGSTVLRTGYGISHYNHDPLITPAGKCVMKLLFESPFSIWEGLNREQYLAEKERIREDAVRKLEQVYPQVRGHIDVVDVATPLTDVRYTGVWQGAYEGFLPTRKNLMKTLPMTVKTLDHFYLIGQWTFPGGGLPPSAQSGKWVIQRLAARDGKDFRVR
ncbi:MAG: NAD(P)/FAD-dependent oxidoreductase [Bacteroidales bacterium]